MSIRSEWRELLGSLVTDSAERDRIATEIGIHPITLMRWVSGESSPRPHNLRQLLHALPQSQRAQCFLLIKREFPELEDFREGSSSSEISYAFMLEVLEARATIADRFRFWSIIRQVLQQALKQLDPERVGMSISVVRCMPPRKDGKIRSLRETVGLGTHPWESDLEDKALLLGAESLAGHATASGRIEQIADLRIEQALLPAYRMEHEVSAAASPVMYGGRVAGCLLFSSTQPKYFLADARISLIHGFAHLAALAFDSQDFHSPEVIQLHILPPASVQQSHFAGYRERVLKVMQAAKYDPSGPINTLAEQQVWREIEEALIDLPLSD